MKCRYCGTENESSAKFCRGCGKPMEAAPVNYGDHVSANGPVQQMQISPGDAPEKSKWRKQILIAVVAIGVLLLMIMTVLFLQLKQMKAKDLYEQERYRSVLMLNRLKPVEKNDKVYVGLAYDRLGKHEQAYNVYQDVYHVLEVFPTEIYLDGYKGYLRDGYLLGYITQETLEQQDYTVTGYAEELVVYREELIAGVYDDDFGEAVVAGDSESASGKYRVVFEGEEILSDIEPVEKGGKLLFPAMAIAEKAQYLSPYGDDEGVDPTEGYAEITDDDGVEIYEINDCKYVPEYKILLMETEYDVLGYNFDTEPVAKDDEVYVDLDTLHALTGLTCDLDEDEGLLTLTMDEDNLGNVNKWIEIVMPDEGDDYADDEGSDEADAADDYGWEDASVDDYDDETDWDATDYDVDSDDGDYGDEAVKENSLSGREYYEYVAKYFKENR